MNSYEKIKLRCEQDPEYRARYLARKAENNRLARRRKQAAKTDEQRKEEEARRIAAVVAANKARAKQGSIPRKKPEPRNPDLPSWKKDKPGRLLALCGWHGWS